MIRSRVRVALLLLIVLVSSMPVAAAAQTTRKTARVGMLSVGTSPSAPLPPQWMAFIDALRQLGYVEGQNLVLERRFAGGRSERVGDFARELAQAGVDVIVATGLRENQAAVAATKTIPIVMLVVDDPVGDGLVASLSRPGRNVTGLTFSTTGIGGKYVQLLRDAAPALTRMTIVASRPQTPALLGEIRAAAHALNVAVAPPVIVHSAGEFRAFFARIERDKVGGLIFPNDALAVLNRKLIAELAAKSGVPAIYAHREHVEAGGLMAYGPSFVGNFRRGATFVDKILKGANPAELPVEQPSTFELLLNVRAAVALGLTFPQALVARADEVIR